ncbi:hypothetical protein Tco_0697601 [Tanacetum coccineum]
MHVLNQNDEEEKDTESVSIEEVAEEQSLEFLIVKQLLDEADKLNKAIQEIPETDVQEDSEYESMPEDDLRSVSGFEAADSNNTQGNDMSHSNHIFQDDNAFAERLSLPGHMDHICEEVSSLHLKLKVMESSIIHQVSAKIKSSLLALSDRFARLESELSKTLKSDMGKSMTSLVKLGIKEVKDDRNS